MKTKRILVLLKYYQGELNPFDGAALECALESGAKEIIALTMAPRYAWNAFQSLTRLGVKGVFVTDTLFAGSDTQATVLVLEKAIEKIKPDLIFCGRQSVDGDTGQVPPMLAQKLGFSYKSRVMRFEKERVSLRGGENTVLQNNMVVTFEKIRTLRFPSMFSKMSEVEIWDNGVLNVPQEQCGLQGSPTRVLKSYESSVGRRDCQFVDRETLPILIEKGLQKQPRQQTQATGEKLEKAYFVGDVKNIAESVARNAMRLDVDNQSVEEVAEYLQENHVPAVLWEDREEYKVKAAQVAVLTGAGICADCISFRVEQGKLIMTRPALGGNVTADIIAKSQMSFATVRTVKKENVDVIFSVGKGGIAYIDQIAELAKIYNAEICCSRIVADSGKLPYEKQVGLTGKTVCPKVYVAFGISGAVQHTCAIAGAGTVIAVNTDRQARIFDYADFGIVDDIKNISIGE